MAVSGNFSLSEASVGLIAMTVLLLSASFLWSLHRIRTVAWVGQSSSCLTRYRRAFEDEVKTRAPELFKTLSAHHCEYNKMFFPWSVTSKQLERMQEGVWWKIWMLAFSHASSTDFFMVVHFVLSPYGAGHPPCLLHNHSVRSNWFHEPAMATSSTMKGLWALEIAIFQGLWHISLLEIILVTAVQVTLGRQAEYISNARRLYGQRYQVIQWGWQPKRTVTPVSTLSEPTVMEFSGFSLLSLFCKGVIPPTQQIW